MSRQVETEFPGPRFGNGKLGEVEAKLEPAFRSQFRSLVEDLHFHAQRRGWHPVRQYPVLSDLIRAGWRGPAYSERSSLLSNHFVTVASERPDVPSKAYMVLATSYQDACQIAFLLDGGWGVDPFLGEQDAKGLLALAQMHCSRGVASP